MNWTPLKKAILNWMEKVDQALFAVLSRRRLGLIAYYSLFSRSFHAEMAAVGFGRRLHTDAPPVGPSDFMLRRNVHRIEKGLSMVPRRDVFALDYIEETAAAYARSVHAVEEGHGDFSEVRWAGDVLVEYFQSVSSSPEVEHARRVFDSVPLRSEMSGDGSGGPDEVVARLGQPGAAVPYRRPIKESPPVNYDDLLELARQRRSVRWFQDRPVPRELVDQAVEVAALSPSACNRQPFEFRVYDDPELLAWVASQPGGARGFAHNVPMMIVVVGHQRAYFSERDRHVIYIDGALASMSLLFACETLGLGTCCINWPDIRTQDARLSRKLALGPDERAVMFIAVGFPDPDGLVPYSGKKSVDTLRSYN